MRRLDREFAGLFYIRSTINFRKQNAGLISVISFCFEKPQGYTLARRSTMACSRINRALPSLIGIVLLAAPVAGQGVPKLDSYKGVAVRILQSNNAGTTHHIIDPTTHKVVGVIRGCPHAHNLTTHPDGLYYYCANEQEKMIDVSIRRRCRRSPRSSCRNGRTRSRSTRSTGRSTPPSPAARQGRTPPSST